LNPVDSVRNLTASKQRHAYPLYSLQINPNQLPDFEDYAKNWPKPIERCGGKLIGYFLPTKFAGRTDSAIALIDFPSLAPKAFLMGVASPELVSDFVAAGPACILGSEQTLKEILFRSFRCCLSCRP
jgi:NIPSNAP